MNRKERRAAAKLGPRPVRAPSAGVAAPSLFEAAVAHHRAGRLGEAETLYRRLLAVHADHVDACFNLATALKQQGRLDEAAAAYRQVADAKPDHAEAHYNLGNTLMGLRRHDEAIAAYRRAIGVKPDLVQAYSNLGVALRMQGELEEAAAAYRRAIAIKPDYAEACSNLGNVLKDQGLLDEAAAAYRQALGIRADNADVLFNLGNVLDEQKQWDEAASVYRRAIALRPDHADSHYNLGNALRAAGERDEAIAAYRAAIRVRPDFLEALTNLGNALSDAGERDEAIAIYRRAIDLHPGNAEVRYNLGNALKDSGALEASMDAYASAIALKADHADAHANLGIVLMSQGRHAEATASYRRALAVDPRHVDAHSNLLFCLNYDDRESADHVLAEHRDWDARHARHIPHVILGVTDRAPERRLRVGYVSPDFRAHSVAAFVEPVLKHHDRQAVEVFCYAEVMRPDAVTARLQTYADRWCSTVGLSDDALAARIRADGIDILVDLAGHTAHNRLLTFARKPAPVQVTWLGYPNTTGLQAIDYRLVDAVTDPPGTADASASERLIRLDGGFLCYGGAEDATDPVEPPCLTAGKVTFGSFNNPAKISAAGLDAWSRLLVRLPQARLLLKGKSFADAATRALFLARLRDLGVAEDRVELNGWASSRAEHLALYSRIDIALDTFPYNGTTTTCEALWMGVPVVTLRGDRHAGRVGASLLTQAGLEDWIAGSADDYVALAGAHAEHPTRLAALRRSLRGRVASSPLCEGKAFASKLEAGYRILWRRWCDTSAAG
jgi:predicted O-linked N-acetylglucosamine transferase (SPINDLY family)